MWLRDALLASAAVAGSLTFVASCSAALAARVVSIQVLDDATCSVCPWALTCFAALTVGLALLLRGTLAFGEQLDLLEHEGARFEAENEEYASLLKRQEATLSTLGVITEDMREALPALDGLRGLPQDLEAMSARLGEILAATREEIREGREERAALKAELSELRAVEQRLRTAVAALAEGWDAEQGLQERLRCSLEAQEDAIRTRAVQQAEQARMLKQQSIQLQRQECVTRRLEAAWALITRAVEDHVYCSARCVE